MSKGFSRRSTASPIRPAATVPDTVGDIPAALDDPLVRGDVVPHQAENHHNHVFGDADRVAIGDLGHGDATVDSGLKIDMVRPNAGGDGELQFWRLGDPLRRQVSRPKRLRYYDLGIGQFAFEY